MQAGGERRGEYRVIADHSECRMHSLQSAIRCGQWAVPPLVLGGGVQGVMNRNDKAGGWRGR